MLLNKATAHIWYTLQESISNQELLSAYYTLMSPDERSQHARFRFARDQHTYLLTRALIRTVLSKYASLDPRGWQFEKNSYGRPEIVPIPGVPPLHFNISHTQGLIACVVALDREVGIDVEDLTRGTPTIEIADRFFSLDETTALRRLPHKDQFERFYTYWTLKESYIKARGMGLAIPLEQFTFQIERDRPLRILFSPELNDNAMDWQFMQYRPTDRHMMAVSIRRSSTERDLAVELRRTVPLLV